MKGSTIMKFNIDNAFFRGMTTFTHFIFLNFIYLCLCIPIVTIGAATSAMFEVTMRFADNERGYLIKGYFSALKTNAKNSTIIYLAVLVPMIFLMFISFFWLSFKTILTSIVGVFFFFFIAYLFIVLVYGLALVARYDNSIKQTLKNAFLLPVAEPVRSLGLLLIPVSAYCMVVISVIFKVSMIIFGFAFCIYCSSFLLLSIFNKHK